MLRSKIKYSLQLNKDVSVSQQERGWIFIDQEDQYNYTSHHVLLTLKELFQIFKWALWNYIFWKEEDNDLD